MGATLLSKREGTFAPIHLAALLCFLPVNKTIHYCGPFNLIIALCSHRLLPNVIISLRCVILKKWLLLQCPIISWFPWALLSGNWNPDLLDEAERLRTPQQSKYKVIAITRLVKHKHSAQQGLWRLPATQCKQDTYEAHPPPTEGSGAKLLSARPSTQDKNSNAGCNQYQPKLFYCLF